MRDFVAALGGPTVPKRARTLGVPLLVAAVAAATAFVLWPKPEIAKPEVTNVDARPEPDPPEEIAAPVTRKSEPPAEPAEPEAVAEVVTIEVRSSPKGAFVALNGEKQGRTPLSLELERGVEATVRFSLQGYRAEQRRFVAQDDDSLEVRLKKKSRPAPPPIKTDF